MSYTKGPWHVEADKGTGYCVYNFEGKAIAAWLSKTDAQFIAAAPELLAAAKKALETMEGSWDADVDDAELLRKAIAKAEGRRRAKTNV